MGNVEFRVLGPVEALRGGIPIALGGPRQRTLLALLLTAGGRGVSADRLAEEIWQGNPPAGAHGTIQSYVSRLRASLGEAVSIAADGGAYRLVAAPDSLDAARFERLVDEGVAAVRQSAFLRARNLLNEAVAMWHGPAFGDLGDEGMLQIEAARLDERRLLALEERIGADLELESSVDQIGDLEALVVEHPFRERLWRHLIVALYRAGRQPEALAAYQRVRSLLDEELGLEPGAELRAVESAVLRHELPEPSGTSREQILPRPVSVFVGRENELIELGELIPQERLITLTGVGGVGKTRLALEAVRRAGAPAVFVDLSPVAEASAVEQRVAAALEVREQVDTPLPLQIAEAIGADELWVVLDNCEHVREAAGTLATDLLERREALRIVATSREALGATGEREFPVAPLTPVDAVALFFDRARSVRPRLPDAIEERNTVAAICTDLDGLPLAIELAAARIRALSLEEIASRVGDRFQFLVSWRRLTNARHRTLERAMDWSYELLSPVEQRLLERLSVFAGSVSLDSTAAVCRVAEEGDVLPALERLVDASLVFVDEGTGSTRYRMLETVRQYAARRLGERGETDELRRRHALHIVELLTARREAAAGNLGRFIEESRAEYDNVMAALAWSRSADPENQLRLCVCAWRLWWVRGAFAEGRDWIDDALARSTDVAASLRAAALEGAAGLAWAHGDNDRAAALAQEASDLYAAERDAYGELGAQTILGHVATAQGRYADATKHLERALRLASSRADVALATLNLGGTAHRAGDVDQAAQLYEQSRTVYGELGDRYGVALTHHLAGVLAVERGRYADGADHVRAALPIFDELGFAQYTWQCIETTAAIAHGQGDGEECAVLLGAASRMREQPGATHSRSEPLPDSARAATQRELGEDAFSAAWEAGRALPPEAAVARAMRVLEP